VSGSLTAPPADDDLLVERLLASARARLDMDVALVARISDGEHEVAAASGTPESFGTRAGACARAEDTYCSIVADTGEPLVVTDAKEDPRTADMAATHAAGVGAYVGVPLRSSNGELYGTLCCFSHGAGADLDQRDVQYMSVIGDVLAEHLDAVDAQRRARRAALGRIEGVVGTDDGLRTVFQPIVKLADGAVVGVEALSRFPEPPTRRPDEWFAEAAHVGLGVALEAKAVERAVAAASPLLPPRYLSVNVSPELLASDDLVVVAQRFGPERLVVEVTEHQAVEAYEELLVFVERLRAIGVRLAVDDAGSGYASFRHILSLSPDVIKLDIDLVRGIHHDPRRRSLARAMVGFAAEVGASLVAEGIEEPEEQATLCSLGVGYGQGFLLGRPSASLPSGG
jgi:EAL domain-containing protein (putative c-di-GMP-specific phosphodiesterase class I)